MKLLRTRLVRRAAITAGCAGLLLTGLIVPSVTSSAATRPSTTAPLPVVAGSTYLALGDSVTFGYREADTSPPPDYRAAGTFVGYPEDVRSALGLNVFNAACPGETSGSFILTYQPSNGCENGPGSPDAGYRTLFPLHVSYPDSQLLYAEKFLLSHHDTRAVSLMIGANDGLRCEETTKDLCRKELPQVLQKLGRNVTSILQGIRQTAHYQGQIVLVDYYSLNYANALDNANSEVINATVYNAAAPFGVRVADGYGAFEKAAAHSGGNSCKAGLLTQLTGAAKGTCGVHPSYAGQALLAQTVESTFIK